jgi:large subunit ribosomal protein L6
MIKNFLGEKQPRKAKIVGQTKVEAKGQEMTVSGLSKEEVGQTIANLKSATRIRNRDSRVFQDGFYIIES